MNYTGNPRFIHHKYVICSAVVIKYVCVKQPLFRSLMMRHGKLQLTGANVYCATMRELPTSLCAEIDSGPLSGIFFITIICCSSHCTQDVGNVRLPTHSPDLCAVWDFFLSSPLPHSRHFHGIFGFRRKRRRYWS